MAREWAILRQQAPLMWIIDDSQQACDLFALAFSRRCGLRVVTFTTIPALQTHLEAFAPADTPALILLDYNLPEMSAVEMFTELIRPHPLLSDTSTVLYSTLAKEVNLADLRALGIADILTFPITSADLFRIAERYTGVHCSPSR